MLGAKVGQETATAAGRTAAEDTAAASRRVEGEQSSAAASLASTVPCHRSAAVRPGKAVVPLLAMLGALLALAAAGSQPWDGSWSISSRSWQLPGDLRRAIALSEVFAHGMGAAAILGSLYLLAPHRRSALGLAIVLTASSGLAANGLKACFVRVRPHAQQSIVVVGQLRTEQNRSEAGERGEVAVVAPNFWDARQRSFPSGHAATAWGLAIGLTVVFPRGCWLFALFASLASVQRLTSGAHYPSDVLAGAAIAFLCAMVVLSLSRRWRSIPRAPEAESDAVAASHSRLVGGH
ncbi:MAG: phosphatase PAP2 family protein [Planctomycetales bacterium]|nr:phosphatase PAP2 family protein [Planctomycetales bacterium]